MRVGNRAFERLQNDVYGEMVLAVSRLFLDTRFVGEVPPHAVEIVQSLLDQIEARLEDGRRALGVPRPLALHSFTVLMHWAGARRAVEIAETLGAELADRALELEAHAADILETRCWNDEVGALTQVAGEPQLDAALLLAIHLGFFAPDDPRAATHVDAIRDQLSLDGGLLRRSSVGRLRRHGVAFTVCTFWLVEALTIIGRAEEAREIFERLIGFHNGLNLFSEDLLPGTHEQTGNFLQTYTHVGLINAAFRLSRSWD